MLIKVRKVTFRFYENLSPKLRDYNMRTRSWFPALAAITNQHFGMHFKLVRVPASSPCLPPLLGPRFLLAPMWESNFDLGLCKRVPFIHAIWQPYLQYSLCLWYKFLEVFNLYFICNLMWYICVIPYPTKRKVMSSSHPMFFLLLCRSIVEFFYFFLGMFHIRFVHPRCLYRMISFPLDQIFPLSPPLLLWFEHRLHFKFWFIMNEVEWGPWVVLLIRLWDVTGDRFQKWNMKCGMNFKIFR